MTLAPTFELEDKLPALWHGTFFFHPSLSFYSLPFFSPYFSSIPCCFRAINILEVISRNEIFPLTTGYEFLRFLRLKLESASRASQGGGLDWAQCLKEPTFRKCWPCGLIATWSYWLKARKAVEALKWVWESGWGIGFGLAPVSNDSEQVGSMIPVI